MLLTRSFIFLFHCFKNFNYVGNESKIMHGCLACYGSRPLPPLVSRRIIIHGCAPQWGTFPLSSSTFWMLLQDFATINQIKLYPCQVPPHSSLECSCSLHPTWYLGLSGAPDHHLIHGSQWGPKSLSFASHLNVQLCRETSPPLLAPILCFNLPQAAKIQIAYLYLGRMGNHPSTLWAYPNTLEIILTPRWLCTAG